MDENDYVTRRIGIIGKWQWKILSVMFCAAALGAWQILVCMYAYICNRRIKT